MSRITLGTSDLLEYNPEYGVLICRDCEYAIQKSAVSVKGRLQGIARVRLLIFVTGTKPSVTP